MQKPARKQGCNALFGDIEIFFAKDLPFLNPYYALAHARASAFHEDLPHM